MLVAEAVLATPSPAVTDNTQARPDFQQETLQAWQDYQKTGLHITSDEAIAWLQTWGTDHEQSAPVCHRLSAAAVSLT